MFGNNSLWIHAKRGYLPAQATSHPPRGDVFVDGAPLPSESSQTNSGGQAGTGPGIKTGAGGKPQGYDSHGRYTGPRGGAVSLRDGSIRMFEQGDRLYANADKQAGADSEAGRREPKSLLSATAEELDKIAAGTSQAVTQGAAGAKQAVERTWEELSTNQELHKGVEFGVKAACEVSKDVGKTVLEDVGYNTWDTGASKGSQILGLDKTSKVLGNPAIMTPLNKAISGGRLVRSVFDGQAAEDSKDLAKRLDAISRNVYGVRR